jgi:hypothetical protein
MAPGGSGRTGGSNRRRRRKSQRPDRGQDYGVAWLAVAAAIATAVLPCWAALLSAKADGGWQTALREELTWGAALVEDARFIYSDEAPDIVRVEMAEARVAALRRVAADRSDLPAEVARAEARAELELAYRTRQRLRLSVEQERTYRRPDGSFDLQRRLADERNLHPHLVRMDPELRQAAGDHAGGQAGWVAAATLPVAAGFILAALAYRAGHRRPRRPVLRRRLLRLGYGLLGVAALMAFGGVLA